MLPKLPVDCCSALSSTSASVIEVDPTVATTSEGGIRLAGCADVDEHAVTNSRTAIRDRDRMLHSIGHETTKPRNHEPRRLLCMSFRVFVGFVLCGRARCYWPSRCGKSAITYAITATAAAHLAISTESILSIVSAVVWWMRKYFEPSTSSDMAGMCASVTLGPISAPPPPGLI